MQSAKSNKDEEFHIAVVVVTDSRGVFFGYMNEREYRQAFKHEDDQEPCWSVVLRGLRCALQWPAAVGSFTGLAATGPDKDTQVSASVPGLSVLNDVSIIMVCRADAQKAWENHSTVGQKVTGDPSLN